MPRDRENKHKDGYFGDSNKNRLPNKESLPPRQKVFISYGHSDNPAFIDQLRLDLEKAGFDVWYDKDAIHSDGHSWRRQIAAGVNASDKFLLVLGPRAATSEYVRTEYEMAIDSQITVVPVLGPTSKESDIPEVLKHLQYVDFTVGGFGINLKRLVNELRIVRPLGELYGVPSEKEVKHLLKRPKAVHCIVEKILQDQEKPQRDYHSTFALAGRGGSGKSVLAASVARDAEIRRAFPGGVVWLDVGRREKDARSCLLEIAEKLAQAKGKKIDFSNYDEKKLISAVAELIAENPCLFVLDNIWTAPLVKQLFQRIIANPRSLSKILITTRDKNLANELGLLIEMDSKLQFSDEESLQLLINWGEYDISTGNDEINQQILAVHRECGNSPYAIKLAGSIVRGNHQLWPELAAELQNNQFDNLEAAYRDNPNYRLISISERWLEHRLYRRKKKEKDKRLTYQYLALFPKDKPLLVSEIKFVFAKLGFSDYEINTFISLIVDLSLAEYAQEVVMHSLDEDTTRKAMHIANDAPLRFISSSYLFTVQPNNEVLLLHDLHWDHIYSNPDVIQMLHRKVIAKYKEENSETHQLVADNYWYDHAVSHLISAGLLNEFYDLMQNFHWLHNKFNGKLSHPLEAFLSIVADFNHVLYDPHTPGEVHDIRKAIIMSETEILRDPENFILHIISRLKKHPSLRIQSEISRIKAHVGKELYDIVEDYDHPLASRNAYEQPVQKVGISADGNVLYEKVGDELFFQNVMSDERKKEAYAFNISKMCNFAISRNARTLWLLSTDGRLLVDVIESRQIYQICDDVSIMAISADGRMIAIVENRQKIQIFESETLCSVLSYDLSNVGTRYKESKIREIACSANGYSVAFVFDNGEKQFIYYCDFVNKNVYYSVLPNVPQTIAVLDQKNQDNVEKNIVLLGYQDGTVTAWDFRENAFFDLHHAPSGITKILPYISPVFGIFFVMGTSDGSIITYLAGHGINETLQKCHSGAITDLTIGSPGRFLVSSSMDGTSCSWDLDLLFGPQIEKK